MHSIRLRGPWEYQPLARATLLGDGSLNVETSNLPPGGTMVMPGDWGAALGSEFRGQVRFTRRFAQPTGLDASTRVWLVIDDVDWQACVSLNNNELGRIQLAGSITSSSLPLSPSPPPQSTANTAPATDGVSGLLCPARFDITALLQPRNQLSIDVLLPAIATDAPAFARPGRESQPGGLIGLVRLEIESP